MSCFVVSNSHINAIVSYASRAQLRVDDPNGGLIFAPGMEREVATLLLEVNLTSYRQLYGEDEGEGSINIVFKFTERKKPVEIIKLCESLMYQCEEWRAFEVSSARTLIKAIERSAIRNLPGYESAPWRIE